MKAPKRKKKRAARPRKRKNISFRKYKKALNKKHSRPRAKLYQSFRKEEMRLVRARRRAKNPAVRKAKTGRWYKGPRGVRVRVRRANGRFIVDLR